MLRDVSQISRVNEDGIPAAMKEEHQSGAVERRRPNGGVNVSPKSTTSRPPLNTEERDALCRGIHEWIAAGFALLPIKPDESKGPAVTEWASIASGARPPIAAEELIAQVRSGRCDGVAVVTGRVSGNAEMIELEGYATDRFHDLEAHADAAGLGETFGRLLNGCVEATPGGGLHFYLRVSDGPVAGNTKFARRPGHEKKIDVLAETRGQGGYSICAPSGGRTHETGGRYELIIGSPANTPTFTAAEVEELHRLFRLLDEMPVPEPRRIPAAQAPHATTAHQGGLSPGDDFNERATWDDLLVGWTKVREGTDHEGRPVSCWRRPGKPQGISATVLGEGKLLYVFSTSTSLPTEEALSKFAVYAHLYHGGNFSAAASELRRQGYGQSAEEPEETDPEAAYENFPVDLLPQPLRQFVIEGAAATGGDPAFFALPALAAFGATIGNARRLSIKPSWSVPPIVWTVAVGESGNQKSTGFDAAIRPLRRLQERALAAYETARHRYEGLVEEHDREVKRGRQNGSTFVPNKPEPPVLARYMVSDTTVEALAPILKDNPRGELLARDELRGWMGSFDRYASNSKGKSDEANWLSMYNGGAILVDRKGSTTGPIFVPRASLCITGGIQPGPLRKALGSEHRESGLAARMLMAFPSRVKKQWSDATISPDVQQAYALLFDRLLTLEMAMGEDGNKEPVCMELSGDARAQFIAYYNRHNEEAVAYSGDLASAWSKLEETAARLALIIELVKWAASGRNPVPQEVSAESMEAAIGLTEWFKRETRRIYRVVLASESATQGTARQRLIEWLTRRGGVASAREVRQGCRFLKEAGRAEAALEELVSTGAGDWVEAEGRSGQGGRRFRLSG